MIYIQFLFGVININEKWMNYFSWNLDKITKINNSVFSSIQKIKVAIIDSGVDLEHVFLKDNLYINSQNNFVKLSNNLSDETGHGTMVAGLIKILAPDSVLIPYKVFDQKRSDSNWIVKAIYKAVDDDVDIINLSLGTLKNEKDKNDLRIINAFERAIEYALKKQILVVCAIGNDGKNLDELYIDEKMRSIPASIPGVICTSGVNSTDELSSFSNFGKDVLVTAPAGDFIINDGAVDVKNLIYTTYPSYLENHLSSWGVPKGYIFAYGTSLSSAEVSGILVDIVAKFIIEKNRKPVINEVKEILKKSSSFNDKTMKKETHGYGIINKDKALSIIR